MVYHASKKNAPLPRTIIVGSGAHTVAPLVRDAHRAQTPRRRGPGATSLHSSLRVSCEDRASRVDEHTHRALQRLFLVNRSALYPRVYGLRVETSPSEEPDNRMVPRDDSVMRECARSQENGYVIRWSHARFDR